MAENYRKVFMGFPSSSSGEFKVETLDKVAENTDGTSMGLLWCTYTVGQLTSRNMVKEGTLDHPISVKQYNFLASLNKHKNALVVENYYTNESKNGCLVVQIVGGTFQSWLDHQVRQRVQLVTVDGHITSTLRMIILSLCSLVSHALDKGWCPHKLSMDDLFIKLINGEPTLKVLLSDVSEGCTKEKVDATWNRVKDIIKHCCTVCCTVNNVRLSVDAASFCNFIGCQSKQIPLETYPDSWTDSDKVAYLRLIIQGERNMMQYLVEESGVGWPEENDGAIAQILQDIMDGDKKAEYNTSVPLNYIRLARNVTKGFQVPASVKVILKDHIAFLRKMEEWRPTIWTDLYKYIGPLGMK